MIGAGVNVNVPTPDGVTPLMLAIDNDHNDVARLLLDHGASPGVWDWWGRTPLYIAVDRKAASGAAGSGRGGAAGGGGRGGRGGGTPVARTSNRAAVSSMDIINTLLAAGVDPNAELNMHRPSRGGNSGRFIENLRSTGATPLSRAVEGGDIEVAGLLLDKGANPNVSDMGLTPFLLAAGVGPGARGGTGLAAQGAVGGAANTLLMDLLLARGADINAQVTGTKTYSMRVSRAPSANEGMTALHIAAQAGRVDLVRYLLEKGASPEVLNSDGRKAIDLVGGAPAPPASAPAAAAAGTPATAERPGSGAPRGGTGGGAVNAASAAEIRTLLQNAAKK